MENMPGKVMGTIFPTRVLDANQANKACSAWCWESSGGRLSL